MAGAPRFRRATPEDRRRVFEVFRASLWSYVRAIGMVDADASDDVDAAWERQGPLMEHLERTAAEDWLAEDRGGRVLGMARSIERDGHLQLTHFFVAPDVQASGVGRRLLELAFPPGRGRQRSIVATQHPSALGLYLRFGVSTRSVGLTLSKEPEPSAVHTDLEAVPLEPTDESVDAVVAIDADVLGFRRPEDIRFLLADRPAVLLLRSGEPVGYSFGSNGLASGPAAVLEPADLYAVIALQEQAAVAAGQEHLWLSIPAAANEAVAWALGNGFRIDPFYEMLLADSPRMKLDRMVLTQPAFMW